MHLHLFSLACLVMAAAGAAGPAVAAEAHLPIQATVRPTCVFTESVIGLSFPEIDPSATATHVATRLLGVRCTHGIPLRLSVDGFTQPPVMRQMAIGGTPYRMPYQLNWVASSTAGRGFGSPAREVTFTLTATLTPAQYQDAAGGHYTDTLHVQVTP